MHTSPTTTLFFPLNTEKLYSRAIYRSLLKRLQRKFRYVTTLSSKRWGSIKTTYTYYSHFLQNTVAVMLSAFSNQSPQESYSNNFLCSKKISGAESSGLTAFTSPRSASGEIGQWSNNMSLTREKQWEARDSFVYSPKAMPSGHTPLALPRGN